MNTKKLYTLFIIILIAATSAFAQQTTQKIDSLMQQYYDYGQFNGTVLVAEKGKIVYEKAFGSANMEWNVPNTLDTRFRIGSITKQFTAALIMQLVEEGKIRLDARMTEYLTDYRSDTGDKITIHQLLNHTSGIPSYTRQPGFFANVSRDPFTVADFVKKHASGDLEFEPGTKFAYNNSGYFLLGAIIEKVTGRPYEEVLQKRILEPLGMTNTGYDHHAPLIQKRASGYQKTPDGYVNADYLDMSIPYAAGSIYSTVGDLLKWNTALHDGNVLTPASRELMLKPGKANYGYGIFIVEQSLVADGPKSKVYQHGGGINGFNSLLTHMGNGSQTVIILDNVGLGGHHDRITEGIFRILNGLPAAPPKRSIAEVLYKIVNEKGVTAAIAEYRRLKASDPSTIDLAEGELNTLGYQMVGKKRLKDAIEIFKLNVEMFPASANPYDSLGEAYLADGQKDLALVNYKKAVELDPTNANAIKIIQDLEGKTVKVDPAALDSYVGEYQVNERLVLTISREGDKLFAEMTGQRKFAMAAVSETQFTIPEVKANITFERDAAGKVTGLSMTQGTRTVNAPKIK